MVTKIFVFYIIIIIILIIIMPEHDDPISMNLLWLEKSDANYQVDKNQAWVWWQWHVILIPPIMQQQQLKGRLPDSSSLWRFENLGNPILIGIEGWQGYIEIQERLPFSYNLIPQQSRTTMQLPSEVGLQSRNLITTEISHSINVHNLQ